MKRFGLYFKPNILQPAAKKVWKMVKAKAAAKTRNGIEK
jgi:hypothetical protein